VGSALRLHVYGGEEGEEHLKAAALEEGLGVRRRGEQRTHLRWDGMGWDGMGRDGIGWGGTGRDGMGWDGMGWDGMGWDGMGWDVGWDGMGRDGTGVKAHARA
jgi:hypothetical protein